MRLEDLWRTGANNLKCIVIKGNVLIYKGLLENIPVKLFDTLCVGIDTFEDNLLLFI